MRISAEKINWRVALGELALIVIGILMALAIDSYAGRRADNAVADVYLSDLVNELEGDIDYISASSERISRLMDSSKHLLRLLESDEEQHDDPGGLLIASLVGESITRQPAVWEELQMTGALRLIPDASTRSVIVTHYLDRANRSKTIDENFVPAVRALRALAWDVMPVESFSRYMNSAQSGVPAATVMARLKARSDAAFLLKRTIVTGNVARLQLRSVENSSNELLRKLRPGDEGDAK